MKLSFFDIFTACWWWALLWMLLSFLLGWWLARRCSNKKSSDDGCCDQYERLKQKYKNLEDKYNILLNDSKKVQTVPVSSDITTKDKLSSLEAKSTIPYDKLKSDNLQIVEGIGPKMESILKDNNIKTWYNLADQTPDELRVLLDNQKSNYRIIDPSTWSDQAQLAADGRWEELIQMQKDLDGGKTNTLGNTDSKLEKIMIKKGLIKQWKTNDLKAVEGIGPKIESLLHNANIKTWKELSETEVNRLKEILYNAGDRFKLADPGTWSKQAGLAAEGKFDELRAWQDELNGGR